MLIEREIPKINGSAPAFIALVVILVLIIITACSATVYLLREDMAEDGEALTHEAPSRGRYQLSQSQDEPTHLKSSRNWLVGILRIPGSRHRTSKTRSDKPRVVVGRTGQGWFQTGNGSDWDSPSRNQKHGSTMRMTDQDTSSLCTPRSSNVGSFPHVSHIYSSMSEASSNVHFDPQGVRGLSYADQSLHLSPGIIPSIQSHIYSPPSSSTSSPIAHGSSQAVLASSPEPMERSLSNDSLENVGGPFSTPSSRPTMRTFEGGTKFIEAL